MLKYTPTRLAVLRAVRAGKILKYDKRSDGPTWEIEDSGANHPGILAELWRAGAIALSSARRKTTRSAKWGEGFVAELSAYGESMFDLYQDEAGGR